MISFYILSKRVFLKREELSNARTVEITKKEYDSAVNFLQRYLKCLKLISMTNYMQFVEFLQQNSV